MNWQYDNIWNESLNIGRALRLKMNGVAKAQRHRCGGA